MDTNAEKLKRIADARGRQQAAARTISDLLKDDPLLKAEFERERLLEQVAGMDAYIERLKLDQSQAPPTDRGRT